MMMTNDTQTKYWIGLNTGLYTRLFTTFINYFHAVSQKQFFIMPILSASMYQSSSLQSLHYVGLIQDISACILLVSTGAKYRVTEA